MSAVPVGAHLRRTALVLLLDEHADPGAKRRHVANDRPELEVLHLASFELGDSRLRDPQDLCQLVLRHVPAFPERREILFNSHPIERLLDFPSELGIALKLILHPFLDALRLLSRPRPRLRHTFPP